MMAKFPAMLCYNTMKSGRIHVAKQKNAKGNLIYIVIFLNFIIVCSAGFVVI